MPGTAANRITVPRVSLVALILVAVAALSAGCSRPGPSMGTTSLKAANPVELQKYLFSHKPDVALFRLRGPFPVTERTDLEIPVTPDVTVSADLFLCAQAKKAPLVILLHGFHNSKEDHAYQAMHLASWGLNAMTIQLSKEGPWSANGRTLVQLVEAIHRAGHVIDSHIDTDRIILAGHSFGASSVSTALGEGAPAMGGILLDPAGIGRRLPELLQRIAVPVMIIGADEDVWPTRNRGYFFRFIPGAVGEISIRDAIHEDAQYPDDRTLRAFQDHPLATEEAQITFVSALTATALGLAATGGLDYGWNSFEGSIKKGAFFNARRK